MTCDLGFIRALPSYFFFSSRRRHTRWPRDWSSDVCSSDLGLLARTFRGGPSRHSSVGGFSPTVAEYCSPYSRGGGAGIPPASRHPCALWSFRWGNLNKCRRDRKSVV